MTDSCDHGLSPMSGCRYSLTATYTLLRTWVRCWDCDLQVLMGWRWRFRGVSSGLIVMTLESSGYFDED